MVLSFLCFAFSFFQDEEDLWVLEPFSPPSGEVIEVGGLDFDSNDPIYSSYDCMVCGLDGCGEGLDNCIDWLGDGYCDDGSFGFDFTCEIFGCDCGDCGIPDCEDPNGFCGDIVECTTLENLVVEGMVDLDGDGTEDPCYTASDGTVSNYFYLTWGGDCSVTDIYWTDDTGYTQGGNFGVFSTGSVLFYGFGPNETYDFMVGNSTVSPMVESNTATATSSSEDCANSVMGCTPGLLEDCEGNCFNNN